MLHHTCAYMKFSPPVIFTSRWTVEEFFPPQKKKSAIIINDHRSSRFLFLFFVLARRLFHFILFYFPCEILSNSKLFTTIGIFDRELDLKSLF